MREPVIAAGKREQTFVQFTEYTYNDTTYESTHESTVVVSQQMDTRMKERPSRAGSTPRTAPAP